MPNQLDLRCPITVSTADQQLYRLIQNITRVYPDLFTNFLQRLGGMHMAMNFIGCIGTLMSNTGLQEIVEAAFA
jgi:hypothetical protein